MSFDIKLMQQALGINEHNLESYRNYYLVSPEHPDNSKWKTLVRLGLALNVKSPEWARDDVLYQLTEAGKSVALTALLQSLTMISVQDKARSESSINFELSLLAVLSPVPDCKMDLVKDEVVPVE